MQMHLKVLGGGHDGKLIAVNIDKFLIGRSEECQLRPKSESISRRHCAIVRKDGNILLIDLKSRNGTHVNEKKLDPSKAKILKNGDKIRVGKLEFEALIEVGIDKVKKPEIKSVQEAAVRAAAADAPDSRYEEVDVSMWLDEAEQIQRGTAEPSTRQFHIDESSKIDMSSEHTVMEGKAGEETKADVKPGKPKPGKLPPIPAKPMTNTSKDAASETLRKFFGGR
jgi:pSer/pThr/pTyr-binding forkhead associated (FHA) protein